MGVRSEYQKHFKVSALRKSLPNYYENVAFRTARRDREYAHTPLSWNDEDTESVETDSGEDVEIKHDCPEKTTDEVVTKSSEEQLQLRLEEDSPKVSNDLENDNVPETVSQKTSCIESDICKEKENKKCAKQSPQKGTYNKTFVIKQGKQRRPDRKQKIPTRPTSSKLSPRRPGSKGRTSPRPVEHPAPFVSYGWGDVERDLSQHKTFNVRASADVHPAAIRALSRRKTAAERRSETVKKSAEDKVKALLDAAALKQVEQGSEWKSEYQQRYPAYDESEYIRSVSARSNDRKLCRVVYVL